MADSGILTTMRLVVRIVVRSYPLIQNQWETIERIGMRRDGTSRDTSVGVVSVNTDVSVKLTGVIY